MMRPGFWLFLLATLFAAVPVKALELLPGDRVCLIGSALAENLQREGWLETLVQVRFPEHRLAFRNLGAPGEILDLRLKEDRLENLDQWLTKWKAGVILAFYGTNESFAGADGLDEFKGRLDRFLIHLLSQSYNGKEIPRVVLFSPLAHGGDESRTRLRRYSEAMAEAARRRGIEFVDLHALTEALALPKAELDESERAIVAGLIDRALFGEPPLREGGRYARVQEAVVRKDLWWRRLLDAFAERPGAAGERVLQNALPLDQAVWAAAAAP